MVRNVINEVLTQSGFHDLHVFDEYLIKVASLFMCDCRVVECRSKFQSLQRFTNFWELLIKVSTNYYLRFSVSFQNVCSYLEYSCCSFLHPFILSRLNVTVEDIYTGASYYCFCPAHVGSQCFCRCQTNTLCCSCPASSTPLQLGLL